MQRANGSVLAAHRRWGVQLALAKTRVPQLFSVTTCHHTVREPCLRTLHPNPAFLRRNHKGRRSLCVFCLVFIFILVFVFLVQHNLELLKAFQPKCGEKTGKAFFSFLHKTSILNSANESGASNDLGRPSTPENWFRFPFYGLTQCPPPSSTQSLARLMQARHTSVYTAKGSCSNAKQNPFFKWCCECATRIPKNHWSL